MKTTPPLRRWLQPALLSLGLTLLLPGGVSAAFLYDVTVDTSSIGGVEGFVDLQFNPAMSDAPAATATVTLFELVGGTLAPAPMIDGAVTGSLPGPVVLENSTSFNAFLQPVTFGTSLSFRVAFDGDFIDNPSTTGTVFSVGILDASWLPLLDSNPVSGATAEFNLVLGNVNAVSFSDDATLTAVPEPHTWLLLAAGLLVLVPALRRRQG